MESLVVLSQGKDAVVRTFDIFNGFGYATHRMLKKVIDDNRESFSEIGLMQLELQKPMKGTKGGRPEESYLLNERQFTLLVMLVKNTPGSIELKRRIESEFFRMRNALAQQVSTRSSEDWRQVRKDGKVVYLQKTCAIKQFVDYATNQGSTSANMYYGNLAKMENKALFLLEQKFNNVREFLNVRQLGQVMVADQIVEKALEDGMNKGLHYKEIYLLAKDRVIQFSEILGKSLVIDVLENPRLS